MHISFPPSVILNVDGLDVLESDGLVKDLAVERRDEEGCKSHEAFLTAVLIDQGAHEQRRRTIHKFAMEDGHAHDAADELEVLQMIRVDCRIRIYLQRVDVAASIR